MSSQSSSTKLHRLCVQNKAQNVHFMSTSIKPKGLADENRVISEGRTKYLVDPTEVSIISVKNMPNPHYWNPELLSHPDIQGNEETLKLHKQVKSPKYSSHIHTIFRNPQGERKRCVVLTLVEMKNVSYSEYISHFTVSFLEVKATVRSSKIHKTISYNKASINLGYFYSNKKLDWGYSMRSGDRIYS